MLEELDEHMRKETTLFPVMSAGGEAIADAITTMREDERQEQTLARIAAVRHGFRLPKGRAGRGLGSMVGLDEDRDENMSLENSVPFLRFEGMARSLTAA